MRKGSDEMSRLLRIACVGLLCLAWTVSDGNAQEEGEQLIFAVVSKISKDHRQITAHVLVGAGAVQEAPLLPTDTVQDNPVWRKLEICQSLRIDGIKSSNGIRVLGVKILDAGMLPMSLQGIAGDCLMKRALEFAPAID